MIQSAKRVVNEAVNRGLRPPPPLTVSEWAERKRIVAAPTPWPGPWRNHRTPYLRQIMDCLSPFSAARTIAVMKGTQLGATEAGMNWVGFTIDQCPASMMIVLPDMETTKEWSKLRLERLVEVTECLHGKLQPATKKGGNTMLSKRFPGGFLKFTWASSAAKMRSTPASNLLLDEVDAFQEDTDGEGDPVTILKRRFTNFPRGKMLMISSPTGQRKSRIEREFQAGDQRYYFLPCPDCSYFQRLAARQFEWEEGRFDTVAFRCKKCETRIAERYKQQMLARGEWVATAFAPHLKDDGFASLDDVAGIIRHMQETTDVSFHISARYSPPGCYSWAQMAKEKEAADQDVSKLKVFVNCVDGKTWQDRGEAPDWRLLYERAHGVPNGEVPRGGLFLTLSVDVQERRLECEVKAWGRGKENWSVFYTVIECRQRGADGREYVCSTVDSGYWSATSQLAELLARDWPVEGGGTMRIMAAGIDTGHNAEPVYDFCRRYPQPMYGPAGAAITVYGTCIPIKGGHSWDRIIEGFSSVDAAQKREGLRIVTVGSSALKAEAYALFHSQRPPLDGNQYPPGYCHFPRYEESYFQGLCAESKVVSSGGKVEWRKDSARNEPLDLHAYNRALAELCGVSRYSPEDWEELERRLAASRSPVALPGPLPPRPTAAQGSWFQTSRDRWL